MLAVQISGMKSSIMGGYSRWSLATAEDVIEAPFLLRLDDLGRAHVLERVAAELLLSAGACSLIRASARSSRDQERLGLEECVHRIRDVGWCSVAVELDRGTVEQRDNDVCVGTAAGSL